MMYLNQRPAEMPGATETSTNCKPRVLSIAKQRQAMAERGDVGGLFRVLRDSDFAMISIPDVGRLLLRAIEVKVQADPTGFSDEVFAHILAFTGFMAMQGMVYATKIARVHANEEQHRGLSHHSDQLSELLPELVSLQRHFVELAQIHAATQRLRQLTLRTQLENERLEQAQHRRLRSQKSTDRPVQMETPTANGEGGNGIAKLLEENRSREPEDAKNG
jgi:hypothetical protein